MKTCVTCKHFRDAHYSKVYITPRCTIRGDDDAMWMRSHLCGLDGEFHQPKHSEDTGNPVDKEWQKASKQEAAKKAAQTS